MPISISTMAHFLPFFAMIVSNLGSSDHVFSTIAKHAVVACHVSNCMFE